jgi:hypothetical protein
VSAKQVILIGVLLGITAACIVWYLERFEMRQLHAEVQRYLGLSDEFRDWLSAREGGAE